VATIPSPRILASFRSPLRLGGLLSLLAVTAMMVACAQVGSPRGWMPPTPVDGMLLLGLKAGQIAAVDPQGWQVRWRFPEKEKDIRLGAFYGAPAVGDELIYVGSYDGSVHALERGGRLRWRFKTDGPVIGGLVWDARLGLLLVPSDDGRLYALNAQDGTLLPGWPFRTGKGIWSRPALADDTAYVGSLDGKVYALALPSGQERWRLDLGAGIVSDPVLAGHLLLVGGVDRRLHAIDVRDGRRVWQTPFRADNWFWAQPVVMGDVVYAANLDGNLYAISLADGSLRWRFPTQEPVRSRPLLVGDVLVVADRGGNVYGLDPASGQARWGPQALGGKVLADLLLLGGEVLVLTQEGRLFVLDPATGQAQGVDIGP